MDKCKCRQYFRYLRSQYAEKVNDVKEQEENMFKHVVSFLQDQQIGNDAVVATYLADANEISCNLINNYLLSNGYQVAVPKMYDGIMRFVEFTYDSKLVTNPKTNILEPLDDNFVDPYIILAPLLAFDVKGNRLGSGQGNYDKALGEYYKSHIYPIFVGIAFDFQEIMSLHVEEHDIPLNAIITCHGYKYFTFPSLHNTTLK